MTALTVNSFFDITTFEHKELFHAASFVWQALSAIPSYLSSQTLGKNHSQHQEYAYFVNPELITIGDGTIIEPGAYIKGPCIIGKNCHIRHGAYIRGNVIVGDNCVIGHATEMKSCILLNGAKAPHFAYVADSILGNRVNLGAGVRCANLLLTHGHVTVHLSNETIDTGMKKFGAIIGDDCQIGCNVVLNPGTLMQKGCFCYPSINISGVIPENSIVRVQKKLEIIPKKVK